MSDKWYPTIVVRCQHCKGVTAGEVLIDDKPRKSDFADVGAMVIRAALAGRLVSVETCCERFPISIPTCHCPVVPQPPEDVK